MAELILLVFGFFAFRFWIIATFKITYYELKLENRNIKNTVKNYGLIDIFKG